MDRLLAFVEVDRLLHPLEWTILLIDTYRRPSAQRMAVTDRPYDILVGSLPQQKCQRHVEHIYRARWRMDQKLYTDQSMGRMVNFKATGRRHGFESTAG